MTDSGREALSDVREWTGGPPESPGVVGSFYRKSEKPSRMSGSGRVAFPDVREWSGGSSKCPAVVGGPPG